MQPEANAKMTQFSPNNTNGSIDSAATYFNGIPAPTPSSSASFDGDGDDEDEDESVRPHKGGSGSRVRRACRPARMLSTRIDKHPFAVLYREVQKEQTVSKRESIEWPEEEKRKPVSMPVRLMGEASPTAERLYVVAKDICALVQTRKGNVAKAVAQFSDAEKAQMNVLCLRSNGTPSTHALTVLTVAGVRKLLAKSRHPQALQVFTWLIGELSRVCGAVV
jgi:hypothetical protein